MKTKIKNSHKKYLEINNWLKSGNLRDAVIENRLDLVKVILFSDKSIDDYSIINLLLSFSKNYGIYSIKREILNYLVSRINPLFLFMAIIKALPQFDGEGPRFESIRYQILFFLFEIVIIEIKNRRPDSWYKIKALASSILEDFKDMYPEDERVQELYKNRVELFK